jgi:hypothetical protein
LYRRSIRLNLPTVVFSSVVCQFYEVAQVISFSLQRYLLIFRYEIRSTQSFLSLHLIFYLELECLFLPQNPSPDYSENPTLFSVD